MKILSIAAEPKFYHKPDIQPLGETPFSKEIRICMGKGAFMKEHQAPAPITIELFSGKIELSTPKEKHIMCAGEIAVFDAKAPHSLFASEDSIIRLTLSKSDSIQRVKNLILKP